MYVCGLDNFRPYILNGFLLTVPVLCWNMVAAQDLPPFFYPASFEREIPLVIILGEHIFRFLFFAMVFLMPLPGRGSCRGMGWTLYSTGLCLYVVSWLLLMWAPDSAWSQSLAGVSAPSWTPLLWMLGIVYICDAFSFGLRYRRWIPLLTLFLFLLFHNLHVVYAFRQYQFSAASFLDLLQVNAI